MREKNAGGRVAASAGIDRRALLAGVAAGLAMPSIVRGAEPEAIRIGQIEPLTGPSAAYGIRARAGADLAVEEIARTGLTVGGTTYRLTIEASDMANDARQALTLLRQFASDARVVCAVGPTNSVGYVPLIPVAGQLKMPLIGDGSGAPIKE